MRQIGTHVQAPLVLHQLCSVDKDDFEKLSKEDKLKRKLPDERMSYDYEEENPTVLV